MKKEIGCNVPQRVTLGVNRETLGEIMEEWLYREAPVALTIRKARTRGLFAVIMDVDAAREPKGLYFAAWCVGRRMEMKVDIRAL